MNVSDILLYGKKQSHTSDAVVSDDEALFLLNTIYHDTVNTIKTMVGENFLYQEWEIETIAGQNMYPLDKATAIEDGIDKVIDVRVKYKTTDTEYTVARPGTLGQLDRDLAHYETAQSFSDPFYLVLNDVLKIYPTPQEAVTDGIVLSSLLGVPDLTLTTLEADIRVPREHHTVLMHGLMWCIFQKRGLVNDEAFYRQKYAEAMQSMIHFMSNKVQGPISVETPNLSYLD